MAAQFGRRLRKGATATTVAALVVAALSASQAPGSTSVPAGERAGEATEPPGTPVTGNSPYFTDLPPLNTPNKPNKPGTSIDLPVVAGPAEAGIPATVLDAYKRAEETIRDTKPGCRLPWQLLAAIGKVESGQARGGRVDANGTTLTPILGPQLNGVGFANISDTDDGAYDGDTTHDRAVGPMQFIPSTWAVWGQDGNADGRKNPNNIYDAALAAGRYLCAHDRDLSAQGDLDQAILGYNRSREYLRTVMSWFDYYRRGNHEVPDGTGVLPGSGEPDSHGEGRGSGNGLPNAPVTTPPSTPETPGPGKPSTPGRPGGGDGTKPPTNPPTTPPVKPPTTPPGTKPPTTPPPATQPPAPAPAPVTALERLGSASVTATEGEKFTDRLRVRAKTSAGKVVAGARVQFQIIGDTAARFPGAETRIVVTTGTDGIATAPTIGAGGRPGKFMVRAKALGTTAPAVDFAASVAAKPAPAPRSDALVRTSDKELKAGTGGSFADAVEVKATYKGKAAAGVGVSATMVTDDADQPVENDKGPYFKDADGKTVRTLTALKTDANGLLKLPEIFTDGNAGTYKLRLTTADGVVLTVELTVTAATTDPSTDPSTTPSSTPTE
ncbi:lytic transglycosylase domain-containing protein [Streptomyces sp. ISL-99]|uniref:lytic transglycosylase domain-containing protein n=1 Tax=Streptomyces sp. ISL-99 TaxID=2819193 RepID=UPI001BEC864C|nr:lytic transglycosylase domain-containing protein [Streptomyces sp. ISL-99]MBT2528870.1 lytic transglycosylase domain-containing protein [Streptomyces sp. ISL-99]